MRVSEYYKLGRTQASLDFIDVDIVNDIELYIDPYSFEIMDNIFSNKCKYLINNYFQTLLEYIKINDIQSAKEILEKLNEPNETHLGMSIGESKGRGLGPYLASEILTTLQKSKAVTTGLLQNIEESSLIIEGISYDIISDMVTNIIRSELIEYTQNMCYYYNIPLEKNIASGPMWDPIKKEWYNSFVDLPLTNKKTLLLIPRAIVRKKTNYDIDEYYNHYVLDFLQTKEFASNSNLIKLLKNGNQLITKKSLKEKYGTDKKGVCVRETLRNPEILSIYREAKESIVSKPLEDEELIIIENSKHIDYQKILNELKIIPTGKKDADKYEKVIEELITALFSPDLMYPNLQHKIHEGRKRIDITYTNIAKDGIFYWIAMHRPASHIFIECKNYSVDLANPEYDQLAGRFSPSRGQVGFLVCRKNENKELALKRAIDTAKDLRGYIIVLEDTDFEKLVELRLKLDYKNLIFSYLKEKFDSLIM